METVIVGISVAIITYLFTPILNWNIDRRKQVYAQKVLLISQWRQMLADTYKSFEDHRSGFTEGDFDTIMTLKKNQSLYSLKPHLSEELSVAINTNTTGRMFETEYSGHHNTVLHKFSEEVSRIEQDWGTLDERGLTPRWFPW